MKIYNSQWDKSNIMLLFKVLLDKPLKLFISLILSYYLFKMNEITFLTFFNKLNV